MGLARFFAFIAIFFSRLAFPTTAKELTTFQYKNHNMLLGSAWDETQKNLVLLTKERFPSKRGSLVRFDSGGKLLAERDYSESAFPQNTYFFDVMKGGSITIGGIQSFHLWNPAGATLADWRSAAGFVGRAGLNEDKTRFISVFQTSGGEGPGEVPASATVLICDEARKDCSYKFVFARTIKPLPSGRGFAAEIGEPDCTINFFYDRKFQNTFKLEHGDDQGCAIFAIGENYYSVQNGKVQHFDPKGNLLQVWNAEAGVKLSGPFLGPQNTIVVIENDKRARFFDQSTLGLVRVLVAPSGYVFNSYSHNNVFANGNYGIFFSEDAEEGSLKSRAFAIYDPEWNFKSITDYNFDEEFESRQSPHRLPEESTNQMGCVVYGKVCFARTRFQGHVVAMDDEGRVVLKRPIDEQYTSFRGQVIALGQPDENGAGRVALFFNDWGGTTPFKGLIYEIK